MKRVVLLLVATAFGVQILLPVSVLAISPTALKSIITHKPYYGEDEDGAVGCTTNQSTGNINASGGDAEERIFNFFISHGLSQYVAAAIVGNFKVESGLDPLVNQEGGGPGRGLAQWSVDGRWQNLLDAQGDKANTLNGQLAFVWQELNAESPAGDYRYVLEKMREFTEDNETDLFVITGFFMGTNAAKELDPESVKFIDQYGKVRGYEDPGTPHLDKRIEGAQNTLNKFGDNTQPSGDAVSTVSGTNAACGSVGAVDCEQPGSSSLSTVRQNVVCVANQELSKWDNGEMKRGTDFYTYSYGKNQEWCADFASWVYNTAGYPISLGAENGQVSAVSSLKTIAEGGNRFTYHDKAGYTPIPGDLVYQKGGVSHVSIVVSVNTNENTITIVGGNQGGDGSGANTSTAVTSYTLDFLSSETTGYISPEG